MVICVLVLFVVGNNIDLGTQRAAVINGEVLGVTLETKLLIKGEASELSATTNGATLTPNVGPTGTLVVKGTGSVNFVSGQVGNGVYFKNPGQQQSNTAFYKYTGSTVGGLFDPNSGEVNFYLKSNSSFETRKLAPASKYVFDVYDSTKKAFGFLTKIESGRLVFYFQTGGPASLSYFVPSGTEDTLFGMDVVLKVRLVWDAGKANLYLNDSLVSSQSYTPITFSWGNTSIFTLGSQGVYGGGFFANDDVVDEFNILAPDTLVTPEPIGDETAPVLSGIASSKITSTGVTIAWITDEGSDTQVEYGLSTTYTNSTTLNTSMVTSHSVNIAGLSPETTYNFRVKSKDSSGNLATSQNYSFTTASASVTPNPSPTPTPTPIPTITPVTPTAQSPVIEWVLFDDSVVTAYSGSGLGNTGVSAEIRSTNSANGTRYDLRLRNRTTTTVKHKALRVRLLRTGSDTTATIEGLSVALPAEVKQWWQTPTLEGAKYGFAYEIKGNGVSVKYSGPSTVVGDWGGRTSGIVRVDGKAYIIPEFWERQPRKITVTQNEIILTFFEGSVPLRDGEDAWDRFSILNANQPDSVLIDEAEGLPNLTLAQRQALLTRFGIAPENLTSTDSTLQQYINKYNQWMGTAWEKKYADDNPARSWSGEVDSMKTTLFSLFERGEELPYSHPRTYTWRDYGDIWWAEGMSGLHYDWVRHAFKHYLRTGNKDALRWGMSAARHSISVDMIWITKDYGQYAGIARYEKGSAHGEELSGYAYVGKASHTWGEGLFIAAAVTNDPWLNEAAIQRAEFAWNSLSGNNKFNWNLSGETRTYTWPMQILLTAYKETGNEKYWNKAQQAMSELYRQEQASGGKGYFQNLSYTGVGQVSALMTAYSTKPVTEYAEIAIAKGVWPKEYDDMLDRMGTFITTPVPVGAYYPGDSTKVGSYAYFYCPVGQTCGTIVTGSPDPAWNTQMSNLLVWLSRRNPTKWTSITKTVISDALNRTVHPSGKVGYLNNQYSRSQTKILGWANLFMDQPAMWMGGMLPSLTNITFSTLAQATPFALTTDTTAPTVSNIFTNSISTSTATILWNTSELSDTQVEYGLTTSYGSNSTIKGSVTRVTSHFVSLTGLTPNTTYNYRVRSRDAAGNLGISSNQTFKTLAISSTSTTTPAILDVSTKFRAGEKVKVTSNLNVRATASTNGTLLGTQPLGSTGTIVGGPTNNNGFNWWNVNYDSGIDGWSVEDFLQTYTSPIAPLNNTSSSSSGGDSSTGISNTTTSSINSSKGGVEQNTTQTSIPNIKSTSGTVTANTKTTTTGSSDIRQTTTVNSKNPNLKPIYQNLSRGSKHSEVITVQQLLVKESLLSADSATGFYGPITEEAIKAFQRKYNIVSSGTPLTTGYGAIGPKTRMKINELLGITSIGSTSLPKSSGVQATTQTTVPAKTKLTKPISRGAKGGDVVTLQNVLIKEGLLSADSATGFFGLLTEAALKAFQKKYNIVISGTPTTTGFGSTGPKTRAKLNELAGY